MCRCASFVEFPSVSCVNYFCLYHTSPDLTVTSNLTLAPPKRGIKSAPDGLLRLAESRLEGIYQSLICSKIRGEERKQEPNTT